MLTLDYAPVEVVAHPPPVVARALVSVALATMAAYGGVASLRPLFAEGDGGNAFLLLIGGGISWAVLKLLEFRKIKKDEADKADATNYARLTEMYNRRVEENERKEAELSRMRVELVREKQRTASLIATVRYHEDEKAAKGEKFRGWIDPFDSDDGLIVPHGPAGSAPILILPPEAPR